MKGITMRVTDVIDAAGPFAHAFAADLRSVGRRVGEVNVRNGWDTSRGMLADPQAFDARWVTAHKIAELGLITTEVAEAIEEVRAGHEIAEVFYTIGGRRVRRATDGSGADWEACMEVNGERDTWTGTAAKPEGVPSELADIVIRVLDIADAYGVDLGAAIIEKLNHNATRGLHHGGKAL